MGMLGSDGIDLIKGMLTMWPQMRLNADQILYHRYFTSAPRPTKKEMLPRAGGGEKKMGEDLTRMAGGAGVQSERVDKVARKLDFGGMRK